VVPEIENLGMDIMPFQITELQDGWAFCQEKEEEYVRLDNSYSLAAQMDIPGKAHWVSQVPLDEGPNGDLYQIVVDNGANGQLLLNQFDKNGNNISLKVIGNNFQSGHAMFINVVSDSLLFLGVASAGPRGNSYQLSFFEYHFGSNHLDTIQVIDGYGDVLAFDAGNSGYWLCIGWKDHATYQQGGSILLFDTTGKKVIEQYYLDITKDWFYTNRAGMILENSNGGADVFVGTRKSYSGFGVTGVLGHVRISSTGLVEKTDAYPETFGHTFLDYYYNNGFVYVLSKEQTGGDLTHHFVLHVYNSEGESVYSKYIRNTEYLNVYAAITEVNGFHASIIAYDPKISQLVKLTF